LRIGIGFLADNPFYTQRFAPYVGRRCRSATIKDIARELNLDWETVKELDKQYMRAQLGRVGTPAPKVIGIDEVYPSRSGFRQQVAMNW
jgi:transposase